MMQQKIAEDWSQDVDFRHLPRNQAADNNKHAILAVWQQLGLTNRRVFEIGSGTGQHSIFLCQHMPNLGWQTSEMLTHLPLLEAWIQIAKSKRVNGLESPVEFDLHQLAWPSQPFDTVYSANVLHIISLELAQAMINACADRLQSGQLFIAYGPFKRDGQFTTESNRDFDHYLKSQGYGGLIDMENIMVWSENRFRLKLAQDMPANNFFLVFEKV